MSVILRLGLAVLLLGLFDLLLNVLRLLRLLVLAASRFLYDCWGWLALGSGRRHTGTERLGWLGRPVNPFFCQLNLRSLGNWCRNSFCLRLNTRRGRRGDSRAGRRICACGILCLLVDRPVYLARDLGWGDWPIDSRNSAWACTGIRRLYTIALGHGG